MAQRRMISKDFTQSHKFLQLSMAAQRLYFFLMVETDDNGFVGNVNGYVKSIDAKSTQLKELSDAGFVIIFTSNCAVLTHFNKMNKIQKDRFKETEFTDEFNLLALDEKDCYYIKK